MACYLKTVMLVIVPLPSCVELQSCPAIKRKSTIYNQYTYAAVEERCLSDVLV